MFLYRTTIFLGSFLLFLVQPIIAKYFLPFFGGGSNIWIASVLFFMVMLFVGYLYSYWLTLSVGKRHKKIHLLVVIFSVGIVFVHSLINSWISPIMPQTTELFKLNNPMFMVMIGLFISVGIPYFLLSTTSILVQYWASKTEDNPYDLYNYSNVGGLFALLIYPFIIEAYIPLSVQGYIWSVFFVIYGILLLLLMWRVPPINQEEKKVGILASFKGLNWVFWILITTLTSMILLTSTEVATRGVSAGPFAWLLPLVGYIASYVIAFRSWKISTFVFSYRYISFIIIGLILFFIITLLDFFKVIPSLGVTGSFFIVIMMLLFILPFFFIYAHRVLYLIRPKKELLPFYYLCIAIGGVIGGLIINIVTPLVFDSYVESGIVISSFMLLVAFKEGLAKKVTKEGGYTRLNKKQIKYVFVVSIVFIFLGSFGYTSFFEKKEGVIFKSRNFYGLINVLESKNEDGSVKRAIIHGNVDHGEENFSEKQKNLPTAYYVKSSGIGVVLSNIDKNKKMKVGVLGLGAGGIAGYCRPGDEYVFYEINEQVIDVAHKYFTYLNSCKDTKIIFGDARIKLEEELKKNGSREFDVLAVDAFSDDAIPVHLLTKEAFDLYNTHIKKGGVLIIHISNNFLDLLPIVKKQADRLNKKMVIVDNSELQHDKKIEIASLWTILVDKDVTKYDKYNVDKKIKNVKPWTDDYSYIFDIIRW